LTDGIVQNVDGNEINALFRKKLFRSKAAASTGLSEQNEMISGIFHKKLLRTKKDLAADLATWETIVPGKHRKVLLDFLPRQQPASHHRSASTDLIKPL
jgi:hypothetical protein